MTIAHRPADAGDRNLIVKSWAASYRDSDTAGFFKARNWYAFVTAQIVETLAEPDVIATIAYETENDDPGSNAYGFIVADCSERPALVYYTYVKAPYRRSGIARGLLAAIGIDPAAPFDYVCSTPDVSLLERKIPLSRWMPRLGRYPKSEIRNRNPRRGS